MSDRPAVADRFLVQVEFNETHLRTVLLNHTNPGPIIGNIASPLFGQANQPAGSGGFGFFRERKQSTLGTANALFLLTTLGQTISVTGQVGPC